MKDPGLFGKLEADFLEYYNIDILDLYRDDTALSIRRAVSLYALLPVDSRTIKDIRNEVLSIDQNLTLSVLELLSSVSYQTSIVASGTVDKKSYKEAMKNAPKRIERPTLREKPKEKKKFLSGRELMGMKVGERTKTVIAHTEMCVKSRINEGGGKLQCNCPPEKR